MTRYLGALSLAVLFTLFSFLVARSGSTAQGPAQLQAAARAALQSQMSQEGKDCPDARTQYDQNTCIGQVLAATNHDFEIFYQNLLFQLAPNPSNQENLKRAQKQWEAYREDTCNAIDELYKGGTIRSSAVTGCEVQLTRSRMRDLNNIYATVLHL
jgi:uncharacterized protein YecT (DUF1311 family)